MKNEKYSQNVYVYQLKYMNEWNLKENFQALKSDLPTYKVHKVFAGLTDFVKVIGKPHELLKGFCESHKLCKVVGKFYQLCKVIRKFYKLFEVLSHFC